MQVKVTARHFDLTDNLNNYALEEIKRLEKYYDHIIDASLTMTIEKNRQTAELSVKVYRTILTSKAKTYDMYLAIEQVVSKMESQIKRYKAKLKSKKGARKEPPKTRGLGEEEAAEEGLEEIE
jgi:putative sigma-54 modulation protein